MPEDPLIGQLILQVVLIIINAFFAMTEIAVIGINDNKLNRMADEGNKGAKTLNKLLVDPTRFLSTIQVGVTLAGFLGSAFAAENFAERITTAVVAANPTVNEDLINTASVIVITIVLAYFTLVFGELVPKRLAQKNGEKIALKVSGVVAFFSTIFKPVVFLLTKSTNGVLRLMGIDPHDEDENITEEEIRLMVDMGEEKGTIEPNEREMIDNIFEFSGLTAEDVMTHRTDVTALWVDEEQDEIQNVIRISGLSRFPVYDEDIDDVIGVLNVRDYFLNMLGDSKPIKDIIRPAYFVPLSVTADVLFSNMQSKKIHMAVVVDEYGGTNGIVTMEDLLEEIVGNIYDEYDPPELDTEDLGDGVYRMSGSADLEDVEELLHVKLPVDEYDTLGGLVFSELESIPDDGEQPCVEVCGLEIKVEKIEDRRIETAIVRKVLQETAQSQE